MNYSNIKYSIFFRVTLVFTICLWSCERPPELPVEPKISFNSIKFEHIEGFSDSLVVKINFEDGDGDLGLSEDDINAPYNEFALLRKENGELIKFNEPGQPAYNINDWFIGVIENVAGKDTVYNIGYYPEEERPDKIIDTLRIEYNETYYNIFYTLYYKNGENFEVFNIDEKTGERTGATLNGRFFVLNQRENERPLKGVLTYKLRLNFSLIPVLRTGDLRLDIHILDRALHKSNTITTPDFRLQQ